MNLTTSSRRPRQTGARFMGKLLLLVLLLSSCTTNREATAEIKRTLRTATVVTRQVIQPDGQIVELSERTATTTNENTGETRTEAVETSPPKIIGQIGQVLNTVGRAAAVGVGGPVAGNVWDTLWPAITAAGTAAGGGALALRRQIRTTRKTEEERDAADHALRQTVKGIQAAKQDMTMEQKEALRQALLGAQDEDVRAHIVGVKDGLPLRRSA